MGRQQFLEDAARQLADTCPAQARFLLWTLGNIEDKAQDSVSRVCHYCFQFLLPGNVRVRLMPKMRVTPQIQKLLNREAKGYKLNLKQTKLLKKYKEAKNVLLVTCNACGKTTRHSGNSREGLGRKASAGKSSNKTTPARHRHPGSNRGTPNSRTSSGQSTPRSSSRTQRNIKDHFTQLKRLLHLEENKKSNKGDLKNFLLSL
ncbi:UPF0711 protein C18orf21 homolog [Zootoca vivipara]|uniref:UPF0711 protein C18orf21 homolog n=1 Tax=Zootoca vivipara TaxID=8524 RepID=UPI001591F929|nr:UPF0711 protein C18orf21 homolog [Zootoca vivipara]XP_034976596.1 UPF0711 protein C18orf21 homolog [Zootoca vivipara]XP_034976600.1 UPF0711 protein C18orf21 homolog [Zootoca vivipara]